MARGRALEKFSELLLGFYSLYRSPSDGIGIPNIGNYLEAYRMKNEFHVAVNGSDFAQGTREYPFRTISKAAKVAETGDKIIVHEGEYREWVKPEHSGYSNISRITYEAAEGEKVVIKGSERIQSWENLEGTVWKAVLPNTFFGEYHPYKETVS